MKAKKSTSGKAPIRAMGRAAPSLPQKRPAAAAAAAGPAEAGQVTEGGDLAALPEKPAKKARKKSPAGSAADLASSLHIKSEAETCSLQRPPETSDAPKGKKKVGSSSPEALCNWEQDQCSHVLTSGSCASCACIACGVCGAVLASTGSCMPDASTLQPCEWSSLAYL